ncbi:TonB-dependent receptor [Edaphobacter sp. HDX4]|uniref:TonB-dependent receptor n=1 Tax=Edaphobacter sp. HDX4 TaxID=2794064 RepID=UPI002FE627E6
MKCFFSYLSQLFVLLLVSFSIFAQQQGSITGGLNGEITDSTGAVLPGATVTLIGPQGTTALVTDNLGRFRATNLTPGFYDVTIEKQGFIKVQSKHNEVVVNSNSTLNITMPTGSVSDSVEVTSAAVAIDTQSTAITSNLTDTFYNSVPMPRNVSAIFYAAPGVAASQVAGSPMQNGPGAANPSIGGSSGLENLYVVDGVTITDQAFGSIGTYNRNHGSLGTGINLAFIKEVDVKTTAFEPQYGKATGGIVQIVTKSGSNQFHGAVGAYFGPGMFYAPRNQFYQFGFQQITPPSTLSSPQYDAVAELGGYIPHFKDKLFFFGAFNPALRQDILLGNPNAPPPTVALGDLTYSTTTLSWAGKITYRISPSTTFEASAFGDPSRHNAQPLAVTQNALSSYFPHTTASSWQFGSRNAVARLTHSITPSWLVDASYAYNYNHFDEQPATADYNITDTSPNSLTTSLPAVASGLGNYEPSKNNTYSIAANTSKTFGFFGQHTFSAGYSYDHTNFHDEPSRSGPLYPIPNQNVAGQTLSALFPQIPARAIGALTNALFQISAANTNSALTTTDRTCTQCPINKYGQKIYASNTRGTYQGLVVDATGRYHTAYGNDVYQINRYVTINAGVRWEQERVAGTLLAYTFTGSWSPRIGINIDPMGDHRSKLFFNFGRNYWAMPLDAAIRQLGNEQDDTSYVFAPVINADGSYTIIPDAAHNLNGLPRSTSASGVVSRFGGPNFSSSTGEGIIPGTKGEYEDEYVIGAERELTRSIVFKARYTDRRLPRIIEDITAYSPEGSMITPNNAGGIANVTKSTDIAENEKELPYTQAQFLAANPSGNPSTSSYKPPVPGCTASSDTFFAVGGPFLNGLNQPVGGACFLNPNTMDAAPGDGIPDGFVNPVRRYNAVEFEVDKRFSNHWLAVVNFRWGNLWGNFEGAYRNDNGQSDPGISSLFDFTEGKLGLLGDQFTPGFLSTDRRTVGNIFLSYNIGTDTPFFHKAHGLTFGTGLRGQSGVPLSRLGDHPIYLSQGEIPIGGRGNFGRTPSTTQLDLHLDYPVPLGSRFEKYRLKVAMDMFNVTNSQFQTGRIQYLQTRAAGVGLAPPLNLDYNRPSSFQTPFYARGSVRFEF